MSSERSGAHEFVDAVLPATGTGLGAQVGSDKRGVQLPARPPGNASVALLRLSNTPLDELIPFLTSVGLDLLRQTAARQRLNLGRAVQRTPGGEQLLRRLDRLSLGSGRGAGLLFRPGEALFRTLRRLIPLHRWWMQIETSERAAQRRRAALLAFTDQLIRGRRPPRQFGRRFSRFFERQLCCGSGCAVPLPFWSMAAAAAWNDPGLTAEAAEIIHGVLRPRIVCGGRGDYAPELHPNTWWSLIWLSSPSGARPRRMLHVLRTQAGRCLATPHWAQFWDQWVIAEALDGGPIPVPRVFLRLPYVRELRGESAGTAAPEAAGGRLDLSHPDWNADRPDWLSTPWPPYGPRPATRVGARGGGLGKYAARAARAIRAAATAWKRRPA